jgi:hypothetical protein
MFLRGAFTVRGTPRGAWDVMPPPLSGSVRPCSQFIVNQSADWTHYQYHHCITNVLVKWNIYYFDKLAVLYKIFLLESFNLHKMFSFMVIAVKSSLC